MTKRGTQRAVAGTIRAISDTVSNRARILRLPVTMVKPANDAIRTVSGTATTTTIRELRICSQISMMKPTLS
jgi:hypothetical protein